MNKALLLLAGLAVGLSLTGAGLLAWQSFAGSPAPALHGMVLDSPRQLDDFELRDAAGRPVRLSDFRGRWVLVYFGYTSCPDVCPTTMTDLARALDALGDDASQVRVILISIDPERDTPERIADYARAFRPDFIGLSGAPDEIAAVAAGFGIYFQKQPGAMVEGYTMDHTSTVTVVDREGYARLVWPFGIRSAEMTDDLRALLR
jgi:protein SCO1/2